MTRRSGFTVLELMISLAIVTILGTFLIPKLAGVMDRVKASQCFSNRAELEAAETRYRIEHNNTPGDSIEQLRQLGYLDRVPICSAGGYYVWFSSASIAMGCSVHYWPSPAP